MRCLPTHNTILVNIIMTKEPLIIIAAWVLGLALERVRAKEHTMAKVKELIMAKARDQDMAVRVIHTNRHVKPTHIADGMVIINPTAVVTTFHQDQEKVKEKDTILDLRKGREKEDHSMLQFQDHRRGKEKVTAKERAKEKDTGHLFHVQTTPTTQVCARRSVVVGGILIMPCVMPSRAREKEDHTTIQEKAARGIPREKERDITTQGRAREFPKEKVPKEKEKERVPRAKERGRDITIQLHIQRQQKARATHQKERGRELSIVPFSTKRTARCMQSASGIAIQRLVLTGIRMEKEKEAKERARVQFQEIAMACTRNNVKWPHSVSGNMMMYTDSKFV